MSAYMNNINTCPDASLFTQKRSIRDSPASINSLSVQQLINFTMAQRAQHLLLLFVGTIFLAASLAGADSYNCGKTCKCSSKRLCSSGLAKSNCCWSNNKCNRINFKTDKSHCGKCHNRCTHPGAACCNGLCATLSSDAYNCGRCNMKCASNQICCKGDCINKWNLKTDPKNCGSCGKKCGFGKTCCNGQCVGDLRFDSNNCGRCGTKCTGYTNKCCHGVCKDSASFFSDPHNCGKCGNRCFTYEQCCGTCTKVESDRNNCGYCSNACGRDQTCCDGQCLDLQSDSLNCGYCKRKCGSGESCCRGVCSDFKTDDNNCGSCSNKCHRGQKCVNGYCANN